MYRFLLGGDWGWEIWRFYFFNTSWFLLALVSAGIWFKDWLSWVMSHSQLNISVLATIISSFRNDRVTNYDNDLFGTIFSILSAISDHEIKNSTFIFYFLLDTFGSQVPMKNEGFGFPWYWTFGIPSKSILLSYTSHVSFEKNSFYFLLYWQHTFAKTFA